MKVLIVLSVFLAVAFAGLDPEFLAKAKEKMESIASECMAETGASADDIALLKAKQPPTTQEGKCFVLCFQKHLGVFNADGKLDKASGLAKLEMFKEVDADLYDKAKQLLEKCYGEVTDEPDVCDTGLNFAICAKTNAEQMGICEMFE